MTGFEIALTVILSLVAIGLTMVCVQAAFLLERMYTRNENEKKPASKNEAEEK